MDSLSRKCHPEPVEGCKAQNENKWVIFRYNSV